MKNPTTTRSMSYEKTVDDATGFRTFSDQAPYGMNRADDCVEDEIESSDRAPEIPYEKLLPKR
jgi:hypothetical protein